MDLKQTVQVDKDIEIRAYYAGHVCYFILGYHGFSVHFVVGFLHFLKFTTKKPCTNYHMDENQKNITEMCILPAKSHGILAFRSHSLSNLNCIMCICKVNANIDKKLYFHAMSTHPTIHLKRRQLQSCLVGCPRNLR